jgi:hypothetical protein
VLDQARLIENRLEQRQEDLSSAVLTEFRARRFGLSHALLACLPIDQAVTTNYDTLYETAAAAAARPFAVLPNEATRGRTRWLLKLHGSIDDPESIVLTRQDVLRYAERRAALAGIVQALLITRRMLFVGFSMSDDNFHRIADDVRRSLQSGTHGERSFGTSLLLSPDPMLTELWGQDVDIVPIGNEDESRAEAARRMEVFLDCLLAFATDNAAHLLDPDFAGLLWGDDMELRSALLNLWVASEGRTGTWGPVRELLRRFGATFDG